LSRILGVMLEKLCHGAGQESCHGARQNPRSAQNVNAPVALTANALWSAAFMPLPCPD
jgi:hypothetical protein